MNPRKKLGPGDEVEYLTNEDHWQHWPYACIKRPRGKGELAEVGLLRSDCMKPKIKVFDANLFLQPMEESAFQATLKHEYKDINALLADGWVVD
jgi:hypothetical protein